LVPGAAEALITNGYVATLAPDGSLVGLFDAELIGPQRITATDVDSDGNIWVGREDFFHGGFHNPDDKVVKYTSGGVLLLTIKGPMAQPRGAAFDSAGNVYVAGDFDGTDDTAIFKYDATGAYLSSFAMPSGSNPDTWQDILITSNDRLFATGDLSGTIAEFTLEGSQVDSVGLGVLIRGMGLTTSADESALFVLETSNGPGPNFIEKYDLSLNSLSGFETAAFDDPWDGPLNGGLELASNGRLLMGSSTQGLKKVPVVHELADDGTILQTTQFNAISLIDPEAYQVDVNAFAVTAEGNYLFGFTTYIHDGPFFPEPNARAIWLILSIGGVPLVRCRPSRMR
jgi:hypothetical protein